MPSLSSVILTHEAWKTALDERKANSDGLARLAMQISTERKKLQKEMDVVNKNHAKAVAQYEKARESYEELKAMALKEPRLSKHGRPLGRPRLSDEEKAARAAARKESAQVAVPADLQPLIPTTQSE